jgi:hypothetical protein
LFYCRSADVVALNQIRTAVQVQRRKSRSLCQSKLNELICLKFLLVVTAFIASTPLNCTPQIVFVRDDDESFGSSSGDSCSHPVYFCRKLYDPQRRTLAPLSQDAGPGCSSKRGQEYVAPFSFDSQDDLDTMIERRGAVMRCRCTVVLREESRLGRNR